jgi:hypothetical protein
MQRWRACEFLEPTLPLFGNSTTIRRLQAGDQPDESKLKGGPAPATSEMHPIVKTCGRLLRRLLQVPPEHSARQREIGAVGAGLACPALPRCELLTIPRPKGTGLTTSQPSSEQRRTTLALNQKTGAKPTIVAAIVKLMCFRGMLDWQIKPSGSGLGKYTSCVIACSSRGCTGLGRRNGCTCKPAARARRKWGRK